MRFRKANLTIEQILLIILAVAVGLFFIYAVYKLRNVG